MSVNIYTNATKCAVHNQHDAYGKKMQDSNIFAETIDKLSKIHATVANGTPKHYAIAFKNGKTKWGEKVGIRNE
jgi:hypothetical protein